MRFGWFGSASARRGGGEFDSTDGFHDFIEYNVEAEALGFHGTFVVEHHFTGYGQVSATLNLLTWLGARTKSLRLGTAVTVLPWHHPVLLAEQAATLDLLSSGRLDFGIGTGYRYNEFIGFDVAMDEAREKFEESIDVILKAWTSNERFSHKGKFWTFNDIVVEPRTGSCGRGSSRDQPGERDLRPAGRNRAEDRGSSRGRRCLSAAERRRVWWRRTGSAQSAPLRARSDARVRDDLRKGLIKSFDRLRTNGNLLIPFVVSLSNHM